MAKRWQKVELTYLKKHAASKSVDELAKRFHTDSATVESKLKELRLDSAVDGAAAAAEQASVDAFQKALEALYKGKWSAAEKQFREVAGSARQPELVAKARQLGAAARARAQQDEPVDPYLSAVYEKNRGRFDEALTICRAGGRATKDERFAYLSAALYALRGEVDDAIKALGRAIELEPRNRVHALHDQDLDGLRDAPGYRDLVD